MSKAELRRMADQAQETAEEKATIERAEAVRSGASALLRCRHRLPQRLQAHPACPGKGVVKHVDQKQNRREHHRECSGNQVLRPDVFHSKVGMKNIRAQYL